MCLHRIVMQEKLDRISIALLRKDYSRAGLSEQDVASDPIMQFSRWLEEARQSQLPEPNAMSVATMGADGRPSSRIVLLNGFDQRGFTWFTNHESRKGRELHGNPHAALLFHWIELERQVHIEGLIERVAADESDACVQRRIGGITSQQSFLVTNRQMLEAKLAGVEESRGEQPSRPEHWDGYRLVPDRMEFWQGRSSRMHDRILYSLEPGGGWKHERMQP